MAWGGSALAALVLLCLQAPTVSAVGRCYTACKPRHLHGFVARAAATRASPSHLVEQVDASGARTCTRAPPPPALRRRGSAHRPRPWAPARGRHGVGRVPLCGRERAQPRADRGQLEQPPPDVAAERGRNLGPLVRGPAARGPGSAHVRAQLLRRRLLPHQVCVPCALVLAHVCAGADLGGTR